MRKFFITIGLITSLFFHTSDNTAQITLSEIMFDPLGSEHYDEFIEIFNADSQTVDLTDWRIRVGNGIDKIISPDTGAPRLPSQQYALILDSGYFENSTSYDNLIPAGILILTIDNNTFGSGGLSNSRAETISLLNAAGHIVSQYTYSIGNQHGYSDEKIDLTGPDDASNWANSKVLHGTPGFTNSVARPAYDLCFSEAATYYTPKCPQVGDSVDITVTILNHGTQPCLPFSLEFYLDSNKNLQADPGELIEPVKEIESTIVPGDSLPIRWRWTNVPSGRHQMIVRIRADFDLAPLNNQTTIEIVVGVAILDVIINEVMYRPAGGNPEWVELYNRGEARYHLRDWTLSDQRTPAAVTITTGDFWLEPGGFAVVAEDSLILNQFPEVHTLLLVPSKGFPALNNDGDAVVIRDFIGRVSDSLYYESTWGGELGVSLERISSTTATNSAQNWASCQQASGATPGLKNSYQPADFDLALSADDFKFKPETVRAPAMVIIKARVENQGLKTIDSFQVIFFVDENDNQIFEDNEIINTPLIGQSLGPGSAAQFQSDWFISAPGLFRVGVIIQAPADEKLSNNQLIKTFRAGVQKGKIIINEFLYRPFSGQAEWVELFNPHDETVNLKGWSLSDVEPAHSMPIEQETFEIAPRQFSILASDSSFWQQYPDVNCPVYISPHFPALNNDEDALVLTDLAGLSVDSVYYFASWGSQPGVSLERLFWQKNPVDARSWHLSLDADGATPGAVNSVEVPEVDLKVEADEWPVIPEKPGFNDSIQINLALWNCGKTAVTNCQLLVFNSPQGDSLLENPVVLMDILQIIQPDSALPIKLDLPPSPPGHRWLLVVLEYPADQNPDNNMIQIELTVGFPPGQIVMNEIMYTPKSGQNEWIELYNRGEMSIDLGEWAIADGDVDTRTSLTPEPVFLAPKGFAILTNDSTVLIDWPEIKCPLLFTTKAFPALNNDSEKLWLFDLNGNLMDSLFYESDWGGASGISLERINPDIPSTERTNWNSCVAPAGGTPGQTNSIFIQVLPSEAELTVSPNPFSPDNDEIDDFTVISYCLPLKTARVHLKIFDVRGRLIRFLLNGESSGATRSVIWDGRDENKQVARMGIYIIFLQALNETEGVLKSLTKTVVLAHKL